MSENSLVFFIVVSLLSFSLPACSGFFLGEKNLVLDGGCGEIDLSTIIKQIEKKRIVYIGERHDNPIHHKVQLEIIKALWKKNKKIAVGMEMFEESFQNVVDDFIGGYIGEEEFLKRTRYKKRWGFNYNLYKPLMDFFRTNKIPVIALGMDSDVVTKLSRYGISFLTSEELNKFPSFVDFDSDGYRKFLLQVFKHHPKKNIGSFSRFYSAQVVRDERMAERLNEFMEKYPEYQVIVLAGNGHIVYSYGVPSKLYRRNGFQYVTVINDSYHAPEIADFVVDSRTCKIIANP